MKLQLSLCICKNSPIDLSDIIGRRHVRTILVEVGDGVYDVLTVLADRSFFVVDKI